MIYEILLTTFVGGADVDKARSILSGFTETQERHKFMRTRHHKPQDPATKGLSTIKQIQKERRPTTPQWQELHQILAKQPSILQLRTDITEEAHNATAGGQAAAAYLDLPAGRPSTVRWADLPDPSSSQLPPEITQRRIVEITDPGAETILAGNNFRATSDLIQESYHWWLDGIEYSLNRMFIAPPTNSEAAAPGQIPNPATLQPVGNDWIFYVCAKVDSLPTATMPQRMKQGQAKLLHVQDQFKGLFVFKAFDRRCRDTRVQEPKPV